MPYYNRMMRFLGELFYELRSFREDMECRLSALDDKVAALASAEADLAVRVGLLTGPTDELKAQVVDLTQKLADLQVVDDADKAALAEQLADVTENIDKISAVTAGIQNIAFNAPTDGHVGDPTDPTDPVDPTPVDPEPTDPEPAPVDPAPATDGRKFSKK